MIRLMHRARNPLALAVSVFVTAGLLYSPLCDLSCALLNCSLLPITKMAEPSEPSGHCHQAAGEGETEGQAPAEQRDEPGDCSAHFDSPGLMPSGVSAAVTRGHDSQPPAVVPSALAYAGFIDSSSKYAESRPFRSPPKRAVISVYRI